MCQFPFALQLALVATVFFAVACVDHDDDLGSENELESSRVSISQEDVPDHLRDLIPLAEYWGIGDDPIRHDLLSTASPQEISALRTKLAGRTDAINGWLDSLDSSKPMSDGAAAFMFMILAMEESQS
jgi:hypothetical protein